MAEAEDQRPAPIIIAGSLLLLQGVWGLLRALRCYRYLETAGDVESPGLVLGFAGAIFLVALLSIICGLALLRAPRWSPGAAIAVTIAFLLLLEASERLLFGELAAGIDIGTITSFLFTTSIVTLLVLGRRSLSTDAVSK